MIPEHRVADNLNSLWDRIARATAQVGRPPDSIRLVGAGKGQPASILRAALAAGLREIGENYVQEAEAKFAELGSAPMVRHLIGPLQRNKAGKAAGLFDMVQTVDSPALAAALGRRATLLERRLDVLVEVNISGEVAKAGVAPEAAADLLGAVAATRGLHLQGVMGIGPVGGDAAATRAAFARLRTIFESMPTENRQVLSMGMTGDFELAILEGSNLVRIGTALFGERQHRPA